MFTVPTRKPSVTHPLARLAALLRKHPPVIDGRSPCHHRERLVPWPYDPSLGFCPEDGTLYDVARAA